MTVSFDASALLAYLQDELEGERVDGVLAESVLFLLILMVIFRDLVRYTDRLIHPLRLGYRREMECLICCSWI